MNNLEKMILSKRTELEKLKMLINSASKECLNNYLISEIPTMIDVFEQKANFYNKQINRDEKEIHTRLMADLLRNKWENAQQGNWEQIKKVAIEIFEKYTFKDLEFIQYLLNSNK